MPSAVILDLDWIKEDGKVAAKYFAAVGIPQGLRPGLLETRRQVRTLLEKTDGDFKTNGGVSQLKGEALATANAFFEQMGRFGLFTVTSGELESWLPELNVNVRKEQWLTEMFARLGSDPDDEGFVKPKEGDVWKLIGEVRTWVGNPSREGMAFVDPAEL